MVPSIIIDQCNHPRIRSLSRAEKRWEPTFAEGVGKTTACIHCQGPREHGSALDSALTCLW